MMGDVGPRPRDRVELVEAAEYALKSDPRPIEGVQPDLPGVEGEKIEQIVETAAVLKREGAVGIGLAEREARVQE